MNPSMKSEKSVEMFTRCPMSRSMISSFVWIPAFRLVFFFSYTFSCLTETSKLFKRLCHECVIFNWSNQSHSRTWLSLTALRTPYFLNKFAIFSLLWVFFIKKKFLIRFPLLQDWCEGKLKWFKNLRRHAISGNEIIVAKPSSLTFLVSPLDSSDWLLTICATYDFVYCKTGETSRQSFKQISANVRKTLFSLSRESVLVSWIEFSSRHELLFTVTR